MAQTQQARERILVVDDSEAVRQQVTGFLSTDYECSTAVDGNDGLAQAVAYPPAAVVTDLEMPGMNGLELLKAIRQDERINKLPVLLLTSVTDIGLVNEARRLGCSGFILKPAKREILMAKLRTLVPARR